MAALLPSNTARYKVHYTVGGHSHTMELRSVASPSAIGTLVDAFLTALSSILHAMVIDLVEFAASGSDIFNPVTSGIEGNTYGIGAGTTDQVPIFFNFIARSSGGRRLRMAIFGGTSLGTDFRFIAGELGPIDAAIAVLVAAGSQLMAIDGLTPVWKTYANAGFNAHWQRALRP